MDFRKFNLLLKFLCLVEYSNILNVIMFDNLKFFLCLLRFSFTL